MAELQITVNDGPQPVATALTPILAELGRRKVVAAFFVLGQEVATTPVSAQAIVNQGHVIANHSWDHLEPSTSRYTDAQIEEQFRRTQDAVRNATNVAMRHWRAPRLEERPRLARILVGNGKLYSLSHCDIHADSKDSQGADDASVMLRSLRADISSGAGRSMFRLLFHVKNTTAAALSAVLDGLAADGHRFVNFAQTS